MKVRHPQMRDITAFESELLHEHYDVLHHKSGLDIYIFPKKHLTTYAAFVTKYGAFDSSFRFSGQLDIIHVPDGIAHFLEHKLFEEEDGTDAFEKFAATGADANAFTSFHLTEYVFSCTEQFDKSLGILLDMVTHPHFTEENVRKEIGIIEQEIQMGEDDPGEALYYGMIRAMYHNSPLRIPIAGTTDSIRRITPEVLYRCYDLFYNLHNMALFICGDVTTEQVAAVADIHLKPAANYSIERVVPPEPSEIVSKRFYREMATEIPCFSIGIKDPDLSPDPAARLRKQAVINILGLVLFSRSSEWVNEMLAKHLLSADPSFGYSNTEFYAFYEFSCESDDPDTLYLRYLQYIEEMKHRGVSPEAFERAKKVYYASCISDFDSTISAAQMMIDLVTDGPGLFDEPDTILKVTLAEVNDTLHTLFNEEHTVLAVVAPIGTKNEKE